MTRSEASELRGVLAVFQTPFTVNGEVDEGALRAQIDWLFENGADGLAFAMVSEVLRLSSEERDHVASLATKFACDRGPVVVSVGAESTRLALRHTMHAESVGAAAVMAVPPALHRVSDDALLKHFVRIAEAVRIPLIVQDASAYVGAPLSLTLQSRLHAELAPNVMFKPEAPPFGPRLSKLLALTDGRAKVFEGTGGLHLIDTFRRGIVGTMPAGDLVWALSALWRALCSDNFEHAYRIAGPLAMILATQSSLDSYVSAEKYLLGIQGVLPSGERREPFDEPFDDLGRRELDRLLALLRSAVYGASPQSTATAFSRGGAS